MIGLVMKLTGLGRMPALILLSAGGLLMAGMAVKSWLHFHDQGAIAAHEAKIDAAVTQKSLKAERSANHSDREIEARNRTRARAIEERIEDAIVEHPEAAARPVGPAVAAVLDELRRQGAGEAGNAPNGTD